MRVELRGVWRAKATLKRRKPAAPRKTEHNNVAKASIAGADSRERIVTASGTNPKTAIRLAPCRRGAFENNGRERRRPSAARRPSAFCVCRATKRKSRSDEVKRNDCSHAGCDWLARRRAVRQRGAIIQTISPASHTGNNPAAAAWTSGMAISLTPSADFSGEGKRVGAGQLWSVSAMPSTSSTVLN
jgi:hypothetical protein